VAIGNCLTGAARPLAVVDSAGAVRWPALASLLRDWHPGQLVVGIPCHPDGAPNTMTAACERFARQLEGRFRLPVARVDERYSTAVLDPGHATDDAAAAVILQQWLDAVAASAAGAAAGAGAAEQLKPAHRRDAPEPR
jgi:putative Holliday junction resolvase